MGKMQFYTREIGRRKEKSKQGNVEGDIQETAENQKRFCKAKLQQKEIECHFATHTLTYQAALMENNNLLKKISQKGKAKGPTQRRKVALQLA